MYLSRSSKPPGGASRSPSPGAAVPRGQEKPKAGDSSRKSVSTDPCRRSCVAGRGETPARFADEFPTGRTFHGGKYRRDRPVRTREPRGALHRVVSAGSVLSARMFPRRGGE